MGDVEFPKRARELNGRPISNDFRPKALRFDLIEGDQAEHIAPKELRPALGPPHAMSAAISDQRKLDEELCRRPLDEIAEVIRALTYGEMIEFATSMWNVKPDGSSLTEANLPALLYRWSISRES